MKKFASVLLVLTMVVLFTACSANNDDTKKVAMVADTGTVNDNSFNQSAWEGLQELEKNNEGVKVSYLDSQQASDYKTNLDQFADENTDLIWGIGFVFEEPALEAAKSNPDKNYAVADFNYSIDIPQNLTAVGFRSEEPSFLVGYIAGMTTKTNKVGFIGGINGTVIKQFQCGFRAGVKYAAKELGKNIDVYEEFAGSFSDSAIGKTKAMQLYKLKDCDIIFHAAGHVGIGIIEQAKELNKFVIGVDRDQAYLAPNNVLTSAIKNVGKAVRIISEKFLADNEIGGRNYNFGLKEDCAGIAQGHSNYTSEVYEAALKLKDKIINDKDFVIPDTEENYTEFAALHNI